MGLSRNKVAVPEGAAGSPPFYGVFAGRLCGVRVVGRPVRPPCVGWGVVLAGVEEIEGVVSGLVGSGVVVRCMLLGPRTATPLRGWVFRAHGSCVMLVVSCGACGVVVV